MRKLESAGHAHVAPNSASCSRVHINHERSLTRLRCPSRPILGECGNLARPSGLPQQHHRPTHVNLCSSGMNCVLPCTLAVTRSIKDLPVLAHCYSRDLDALQGFSDPGESQ